ncbi:MAG: PEPxxWA-CTERM sorting domain-containing protein [Pseudomonadota bacterium]|uniref:PEPxxWA-CTERM sorting domain-containing protein n=1 Tax=Phenylobacterium sp. TaxID=1871053 RepID=UPI0025F9DD39|nr:PEPxxWA-CTERM sorting domain-containing protein [Phenylobacterium sp.]MBT9473928.1 PEP-CTERM sorting domain-containing protein [Phenylobacterium sp.]
MHRLLSGVLAGAALAVLTVGSANAATVFVDNYTLEQGSFGTGLGVHSNSTQTGSTVNAYVNQDNSAVTFSTVTGVLSVNGSGEATVVGDPLIEDLTVTFAKAWNKITFNLQSVTGPNGGPADFTLLVNGSALFSASPNPGDAACTFCIVDNGENKFIISGLGITSLAFEFDPSIAGGKQFRVEGLTSGIPEPATWTMMIAGFGLAGATIRRRREILMVA